MSAKEIITVESLPLDINDGDVYSIAQSNPNSYTHCFFKYPCKFIPEIPRWAIRRYNSGDTTVVYDPFSGSGTTLVESAICGYPSFGSEIDKTAKLITKVKSTKLNSIQIQKLDKYFSKLVALANDSDAQTTIPVMDNITHWFSEDAINKLGRIKKGIDGISDKDIRDFFTVCFASIIKKVSFSDDISPKPYVSTKIKKSPPDAIKEFSSFYERYKDCIVEFSSIDSVSPQILPGGAFGLQERNRFTLAITSPPYINAFDYARSMRLENLWLGFETEESIRKGKKDYVGTESIKNYSNFSHSDFMQDSPLLIQYLESIHKTDVKRAAVVNKFFCDMKTNLLLTYNSLKEGGHYIIVIGNSEIRKTEIRSWEVIKEIAVNIGYHYDYHFAYMIKNPYIRIPRGGQGGKIATDYVLVLSK